MQSLNLCGPLPLCVRRLGQVTLSLLSGFALLLSPAMVSGQQFREYPQILGKNQPLHSAAVPSWVTLDFDLRNRSEGQTAISYLSGNGYGYDLTRVRGAFETRPTHWATTFVQFHDEHALALPLKYTAANMRDSFDFRQAYLALHSERFRVAGGRQELRFGGERLVGVSDWTNTSRTFDAITARVGSANHVDLFSSSVVVVHPTALDMHAGGLNFHGAYGTIASWVPKTSIEPYVFVKAMPRVLSQQGIYGTETETTFGGRILGNAPMHFDYTAEAALQRGSYANDSIHAGAGYVKVGYTAPLPWLPRLQGQYDYATGNPHTNPYRIATFDQLYPSSHDVFGLVDLVGWQNIRQARVNLDLYPTRNLTILVQNEFLNVANRKDDVYSGSGSVTVKPPTGGFKSDDIGIGFDVSAKYVYHQYFVVNTGFGHLAPGALMTKNSHGAPQSIAFLSCTYRFTVNKK